MPYKNKTDRAFYDMQRRCTDYRPFIGVDGEGGENNEGVHTYSLLRVGDSYIYDPDGLTAEDCLRLIWSCGVAKGGILVSFFFDYDVTMILKSLPKTTIDYLLDRVDGGLWHFAKYQDFEIDYIPGKRFAVKHMKKLVVVHDTSGFFQSSFLKALELWDIPTDEEKRLIEDGKNSRNQFYAEMTDREIRYNRLECKLLEALMERFRETCQELELPVSNWEGAGNVASGMFRKHRFPRIEDRGFPKGAEEYARRAYYGGRFEVLHAGPVENVIECDLASAYPSAMRLLPCPLHSRWAWFTGDPPAHAEWFVAELEYTHPAGNLWGGFPCRRTDGSIHYPSTGSGWYWSPEIFMACRALRAHVNMRRGYYGYQKCDCEPFSWVPEYYEERLRLGKNGRGIVLKLGLNSLYGKLAQSVGTPRYSSPILAGLITAYTRAELMRTFLYHDQDEVIMFATDAAYLTCEPRFATTDTKQLGMYEQSEPHSIFVVKPGFYFVSGSPELRSRGISSRYITNMESSFRRTWDLHGYRGSVEVPGVQTFIGLRMARQMRDNPLLAIENGFTDNVYDAGRWVTRSIHVSFDLSSKRQVTDGRVMTSMYPISRRTIPYDRLMGVVPDFIYTHPENNNLAYGAM